MPAAAGATIFRFTTCVAIDWSGAVAPSAQRKGICTAVATRDGAIPCTDGRTRAETIEFVLALEPPVVVGFDFSFGFPEWVARCHGTSDAPALWPLVAAEGERWLRERPSPFFGYAKGDRPAGVEMFRETERALRAKSTFQTNGKGTVGTGSVRGMPYLAQLRAAGFAVWPFDAAGPRTVVEIYPSALRRVFTGPARAYPTPDCRDAGVSAEVMWRHRATFATLPAASDERTRREGAVWVPGG
jgi:hypothetical protein